MRFLRLQCHVLAAFVGNEASAWSLKSHGSVEQSVLSRRAWWSSLVVHKMPPAAVVVLLVAAAAAPSVAKAAAMRPHQSTTTTAVPEKLQPVLQLQSSMHDILERVESSAESNDSWLPVSALLESRRLPTRESEFKAIFDANSDPISYKQKFVDQNAFLVYYTKGFDGPGRPSIESDLPTKQPLQYGARNDAWIAWSDFLAELEFQQREQESDSGSKTELKQPLIQALAAIERYLAVTVSTDSS
jgi:hypothetical protein